MNKLTAVALIFSLIIICGIDECAQEAYISEPQDYNITKTPIPALEEYKPAKINDSFPEITRLHWAHMPVTYSIENECIERLSNLSRLAFKKIHDETGGWVYFKETSENPDINVSCKPSKSIVGFSYSLADSSYEFQEKYILIDAQINIYGPGMVCNTGYPSLEVHEILHAFGFVHNPLASSIMQESAEESSRKCTTTKIDDEYINCLKNIYSNGRVEGNCSKIDTITSSKNIGSCGDYYDVEGTNLCCPEPDMRIMDSKCVQKCGQGRVLGEDYLCHDSCGEGFYCPQGSRCMNSECYAE